MRLNTLQTNIFERLLSSMARDIGVTQSDLAESIDGVSAPEISKIKRGLPIGERKWTLILKELENRVGQTDRLAPRNAARLRSWIGRLRTEPKNDFFYTRQDLNQDPELERAYLMLSSYRQINPRLWNATKSFDLYVANTRYSDIDDGLAHLRHCLFDEIGRLNRGNDGKPERTLLQLAPSSDYSQVLALRRAQTTPLLYLFPFPMTMTRRYTCGVIRYGCQKRLGVLVSKRTLLNSRVNSDKVLRPDDWRGILSRARGIFASAGYGIEDILQDLVLGFEDSYLVEKFNSAMNVVDTHEDLTPVLNPVTEDCMNLYVFDLSYRHILEERLGREDPALQHLAIAPLEHGVDVPVGVGFSLAAFPWVVAKHRFRGLRSKALQSLKAYRDPLSDIGIELDE